MIRSKKHSFVFVQNPMTGSSAVAKELVEHYDGEPILAKHAVLSTFYKTCKPEERDNFVFSAIRHPLDKIVSNYLKLKTDHNHRFTRPLNKNLLKAFFQRRDRRVFRKVQQGMSFGDYLKGLKVYDDMSTLDHDKMDFIMRFETLSQDFERVLAELGIPQVRPLPKHNVTQGKKGFLEYYDTEEIRRAAAKKVGPFLEGSPYELPKEWGEMRHSVWDRFNFKVHHFIRIISWRYVRRGFRGHEL